MDDEKARDLYKRYKKGNKKAETILFQFYQKRLEYFVGKIIGFSNPDVQDVVQDIWLKFLEREKDGRFEMSGKTIGAYLHNLMIWSIKDYRKSSQKEIYFKSLEQSDEKKFPNHSTSETELEIDESTRELIKKVISKLREPHRTIIRLRFYESMRVKDIAKYLKIEPAKVSNKLSYAIDMIRERISRFLN